MHYYSTLHENIHIPPTVIAMILLQTFSTTFWTNDSNYTELIMGGAKLTINGMNAINLNIINTTVVENHIF